MKRARHASFAFLGLLGFGCTADGPADDPPDDPVETASAALAATAMTGERAAAVVSEIPVALVAGATVVFQTTGLSTNADPIMSLLSPTGVEVAADNNGANSGKNALIVHTPATTGTYTLVVRAASSLTGGTCTVARNGTPMQTGVAFSGAPQLVSSLRANETLETVRLPNGAGTSQVIYVLKGDLVGIERRAIGNGTAGAALVSFNPAPGSRYVLFAVRAGTTGGQLGWVRNDAAIAGHDADGDGLGNELEAAIGTCSAPTGTVLGPDQVEFDCARVADARDTDGDGISDGWELVGRRGVTPHQPLPLWGANPRHKDIFLELDFMQRCQGETDSLMTAASSLKMAAIYGDQIESWIPLVQLAHAISLGNPDQRPGISLHIDSGRSPEQPAHATIYGNWGGHNLVPKAPAACTGQSAESVWTTQMATARRGIFHYALGYNGNGASNAEYRIYSAWVQNDLVNPSHEFGHSMGFGHSGHAGNNGDPDPNCKPSYPSLMNYAYYDNNYGALSNVGFSDGLSRSPLDNLALKEQAFTTDARYLQHLKDVFQYNVDPANGHVDWNRDGVFSAGTVRAYANFRPGGQGCEWTRYNNVTVGGAAAMGTPALGHLGTRTYVIYTDATTGRLTSAFTTRLASMSSNLACPKVGDCAGVSFSTPVSSVLDAAAGVDAVPIKVGGQDQLLVVANDASGRLWETRLSVAGGVEQWTPPVRVGTSLAAGEPTLAADGQFSTYLAFRGTDGLVRTNRFAAGGWQGEHVAQTRDGVPTGQPAQNLPVMAATASPGLVFSYLPGFLGRPIFRAFADAPGAGGPWRPNPDDGLWQRTTVFADSRPMIRRKPSMAWVPRTSAGELPGKFYFAYLQAGNATSPSSQPNFRTSFATLSGGAVVERVGLDSPFDNNTTSVQSLGLYYDPAVDINVRAVGVQGNNQLIVRPNADGITGFAQGNINDWDWLSVTTCRTLIYPTNARGTSPDPLLTSPIRCRPYVYTPN